MSFRLRKDLDAAMKIEVVRDGPYIVHGRVPVVKKTQIVSEHGEPLTWRCEESIETAESYDLCRCGRSSFKPFCDVTHALSDFDGTETADTRLTAERQVTMPGTGIVVRRDHSLCTEAGFCGNRRTTVEAMVAETADTEVRSHAIAMIERCPSGSFTYAMSLDEPDIEPDLPRQIAVTTEITDEGAIDGPLWVTGGIPVSRADGKPLESRNRVTLCCCGRSKNKPLCDGTHRCQADSASR